MRYVAIRSDTIWYEIGDTGNWKVILHAHNIQTFWTKNGQDLLCEFAIEFIIIFIQNAIEWEWKWKEWNNNGINLAIYGVCCRSFNASFTFAKNVKRWQQIRTWYKSSATLSFSLFAHCGPILVSRQAKCQRKIDSGPYKMVEHNFTRKIHTFLHCCVWLICLIRIVSRIVLFANVPTWHTHIVQGFNFQRILTFSFK